MTEPPNASGPVWPGYAVPGTSYTTPPVRHTSRTRMFVMLTIAVVVVAAVLSVVAWLLTPAPPRYKCPPDCGRPPIGPPLKPASQPPLGTNLPAQPGPPAITPAVVAVTPGPPVESYSRFSPSEETDHPSGASLDLAQQMGPFINSFTWKGDASRLTH
jgi:hypothetical protein